MNRSVLLFSLCIASALYLYSKETSSLDRYLCQIAKQGSFSGAVLVAKDGTILLNKAYGFANREFEIPNEINTKFKIASITKCFTATAIMKLSEKKLLRITDPLSLYLENFPHGDIVTIHHLLTQSSGIPNYYSRFNEIQNCASIEEMATIIKAWPLDFEPGTQYRYSNSGYLILAHIIEKASGIPYEIYLKHHIFEPLGMHNSGSDHAEAILKNQANGYIKEGQEIKNVPAITAPLSLTGNGDIYSSLEDMRIWDQALFSGKIVSKKSLDLMLACHVSTSKDSCRAHGNGWFIDELKGKKYVEYTGALRGFLSKHIRFIDDKISIIILTNLEDQDQFCQIADDMLDLTFN